MNASQEAKAKLGLDHYARGEHSKAQEVFEALIPPFPPQVALSWAALLRKEGQHEKACQILSCGTVISRTQNAEEALAASACKLFEDLLLVMHGKRDLAALGLKQKDRLLAAAYFALLPVCALLDGVGKLAGSLGFPNSRRFHALSQCFAASCWINGIPMRPSFMGTPRILSQMKDFDLANTVYRETFYEYLNYWEQENLNVQDLLLASVKPADAHALYSIVREKSPTVLLEIGTFVGFSTCLIARAVKDNGGGEIHCIDPNMKHLSVDKPLGHAGNVLKRLGLKSAVRFHEGFFSAPNKIQESDVVFGHSVAEVLPPVDFAFIDGDHSTWAVVQDFMLLLPCLSNKATVVFHDTKSWLMVRQGIALLFAGGMCENYKMDYAEFVPSGFDGLGVMEIERLTPASGSRPNG